MRIGRIENIEIQRKERRGIYLFTLSVFIHSTSSGPSLSSVKMERRGDEGEER